MTAKDRLSGYTERTTYFVNRETDQTIKITAEIPNDWIQAIGFEEVDNIACKIADAFSKADDNVRSN